MKFTDTHCHVYDPKVSDDPEVAIDAARAQGVHRMIAVGCDRATSLAALAMAESHPDIWATVGLHPHEANHDLATVSDLVECPRVVAVGECGLDYYYDHAPRERQRETFAAQIELARRAGLALVVHTREAWEDTFAVLDATGQPDTVIFHCFTGGPAQARSCLDRGAYLSFSGIVTFKNADDIRDAARLCPPDRLLIETDAPYLAPVPHRGRPNQPAFVTHVAAGLAAAIGRDLAEVAQLTDDNASIAFGLPTP